MANAHALSTTGGYNVCTMTVGGMALSIIWRSEVSVRQRLGMYGVHTVVGKGHGVCPLVGGCQLIGVSIIGGSTVGLVSCL